MVRSDMDDLDDLDTDRNGMAMASTSGHRTDHDDLNTTDNERETSLTDLSAAKNRLSPLMKPHSNPSRSPSPMPSQPDDERMHLDGPFDGMLMAAPSATSPAMSLRSAGTLCYISKDVFQHRKCTTE